MPPGWLILCPLTEEQESEYIEGFDLEKDPRPPGGCCCRTLPLPFLPCKPTPWERRTGGALYVTLGADSMIKWLKRYTCYPTPLRNTQRGTAERDRALILTIPITIGYEAGHQWGGIIHFACIILAMVLIVVLLAGTQSIVGPLIIVGSQVLLIRFVHALPCLVQRLNRIRIYAAIEQIRLDRARSMMPLPVIMP